MLLEEQDLIGALLDLKNILSSYTSAICKCFSNDHWFYLIELTIPNPCKSVCVFCSSPSAGISWSYSHFILQFFRWGKTIKPSPYIGEGRLCTRSCGIYGLFHAIIFCFLRLRTWFQMQYVIFSLLITFHNSIWFPVSVKLWFLSTNMSWCISQSSTSTRQSGFRFQKEIQQYRIKPQL